MTKSRSIKFIEKNINNLKSDKRTWIRRLLKFPRMLFYSKRFRQWSLKLSERNWPNTLTNWNSRQRSRNLCMRSKFKSCNQPTIPESKNFNKNLLHRLFLCNQIKNLSNWSNKYQLIKSKSLKFLNISLMSWEKWKSFKWKKKFRNIRLSLVSYTSKSWRI